MTVRPLPADLPHSQVFCAKETGEYMRDQKKKKRELNRTEKPRDHDEGSVEFDSL